MDKRMLNPFWLPAQESSNTSRPATRRSFRMPAPSWRAELLAVLPHCRSLSAAARQVGISRQAVYLARDTDKVFAADLARALARKRHR